MHLVAALHAEWTAVAQARAVRRFPRKSWHNVALVQVPGEVVAYTWRGGI